MGRCHPIGVDMLALSAQGSDNITLKKAQISMETRKTQYERESRALAEMVQHCNTYLFHRAQGFVPPFADANLDIALSFAMVPRNPCGPRPIVMAGLGH